MFGASVYFLVPTCSHGDDCGIGRPNQSLRTLPESAVKSRRMTLTLPSSIPRSGVEACDAGLRCV
jgi:hypothetical protein